jgi:solute carrier family 8 (sodium/calcium exchanger)
VAVPEGSCKAITEFGVFAWTAFASLWAYLWMLIVYKFWTPNRVTIVEGILTCAYLPVLVGVAYVLDVKPW